jgi:uncharacterized iron-regulated membrane protein
MKGSNRKLLFRVHAWIGLNLGLLLFVICFSGTLAVFSRELDWLVDPATRVEPPSGAAARRIGWQAMQDAVAKAYPHALTLYLHAPDGARSVARATITYGPGDYRTVLIDPHSGEIRGLRSSFTLTSFFRIFHKQLYIVPANLGVHGTLITGALAVPLLVAAATGFLSLRRWRRALLTLRRGRSPRLFWSDLHRLVGLWALLITIVLALTGFWYFVEKALHVSGGLSEDVRPTRAGESELRRGPSSFVPIDLDRVAALAQASYPALRIDQVAMPARPGDPLSFTGQAEAWLVRDRANGVQIDPYTGAIRGIQRAEQLGPFERWVETADLLHFGTLFGLPSRIIWFVAGLMLSGGILAGLYGAWLRLRQHKAALRNSRRAALAAVLPSLALLAAGGYGTWAYGGDILGAALRPLRAIPVAEVTIGPWSVAISRIEDSSSPRDAQLQLRFLNGSHPNFRTAEIRFGDGDAVASSRIRRLVDRIAIPLSPPPGDCADRCPLHLSIEDWSGTRHRVRIDIGASAEPSLDQRLPAAEAPPAVAGIIIVAFVLCLAVPLIGWVRLVWR